MDELTLLTWNLQGSQGLDLDLVVDTIERSHADVVVLQEVQRRQCRQLRQRLGWSARWAFKHWPVVTRPEGMAVLTPHRLGRFESFVVHRAWVWSWQRRVAIDATVIVRARPWRVMNIHLSPHDAGDRRQTEAEQLLERSRMTMPVLAGDLNDRPGGPVGVMLTSSGWCDAWARAHADDVALVEAGADDGARDPGATNWTAGERQGRPPTQRLDVVFTPAGWIVNSAEVIVDPLPALAALSDHLPLVARVARSAP